MQPSLFEVIARAVIVVLVNGLWQGLAIATLTWLALRLFPRVNASTRYAAWTLALVAVVVVPIVTSLTHISYYTTGSSATQSNPIQNTVRTGTASSQQPAQQSAQAAAAGGTSRSELKHTTASEATYSQGKSLSSALSIPRVPDVHLNVPFLVLTVFFTAWGIAALLLVVRLAIALLRLERLKHDAMPLGIEYRDQLEQWQRLDPDRDVRICVTGGIEVPVAVGLFDAMVLLPKHLLDQFDAQEIDQISLHELAHLLRHDDWTNGLQRVITSLLFFNPAVWFIARQMDVEREVACDDYVLELTGAVRTYAFCLTKMAEITSWPHQPLAAPGVFTTRKNISIRIERLLRSGRAISSSISPATAGAVAIGLLGGYFVASTLTPQVAFAMPCPPAPPAPAAEAPFKATTPKMNVSLPQVSLTIPNVVVKSQAPMPKIPPKLASAMKVVEKAGANGDLAAMHTAWKAYSDAFKTVSFAAPPKPPTMFASKGNGMNCTGCDFEGQNLSGKNFAGSEFTGTNFAKADLQGANFNGANLQGADFEGADLRNASLVGANLSGANLSNAKLDGANLDDANLSGVDLNPRTLSPAQIRAYLPHCRGCDLSGANLSGMDLSGVKLVGADLSKANLRGANLSKAIFSGVDFSGADLRGARTDGTQFIGCDFSGAQLGNP